MMSYLDDLVRVRRDAMRGRVRADLERAAEADGVAGGETEDLDIVEAGIRQRLPRAQDVAEAIRRGSRHPDAAAGHPVELPLPRVRGDARGVVEVRMGDEDVRDADGRVGAASEVEHETEVADAEPRLVTGAGAAFDREA